MPTESGKGFVKNQVAVAVVVQQLVPAEVAGILFTANPVTGARDELVVNAALGLDGSDRLRAYPPRHLHY